jgi:hypothetical protein
MQGLSRRGALALVASSLALGFAATSASAQEIIERVMPELRVEVAPPPPAVGWSWLPGHWAWNRFTHEWVWSPGHYVRGVVAAMPAPIVEAQPPRPGPGWFWVRGHWVWASGRWVWRRGHWDS